MTLVLAPGQSWKFLKPLQNVSGGHRRCVKILETTITLHEGYTVIKWRHMHWPQTTTWISGSRNGVPTLEHYLLTKKCRRYDIDWEISYQTSPYARRSIVIWGRYFAHKLRRSFSYKTFCRFADVLHSVTLSTVHVATSFLHQLCITVHSRIWQSSGFLRFFLHEMRR